MFPGSPRSRESSRTLNMSAVSQIVLAGDDPDFIYIEALTVDLDRATVTLPNTALVGKKFSFLLVPDASVALTLTSQFVIISIPSTRANAAGYTVKLFCGQRLEFTYTRMGWLSTAIGGALPGTGPNSTDIAIGGNANGSNNGVAVGYFALAYTKGAAFGYAAYAYSEGASFGFQANSSSYGAACGGYSYATNFGVSVGYSSNGSGYGVSIGAYAQTNGLSYAVALGYNSRATRYRELLKSADGGSPSLRVWSMVDWYGDTTTATATELFLGGTVNQRCGLSNNSALQFQFQIIAGVTGGGDTSSWTISGAIKKGATAASTVMVGTPTVTMTGQDAGAASWSVAVSADTTNGALKLVITGGAANVRWNASATLSEIRY